MKFIIVFAALFALALAAPNKDVEILRLESDVQPEGYKFAFETSDGVKHSAEGELQNAGSDHEAISVHGSYTWVDKEGISHTVTYVADENGFQPHGDDIPVA